MAQRLAEEDARPADEIDWAPVLDHLAWLRVPDPDVGRMVESTMQDDGSWSWPYEVLSSRAEAFVTALRDAGVVASGIDWSRWLDGRGDELLRDPDGSAIAAASLDDCRRLLVALVRQARFVEGTMLDALRSGRVRWTLERVAELTGDPRAGTVSGDGP